MAFKVMMELPACHSTSAAGSQEHPEAWWVDPRDPLEYHPRLEGGVHVCVTHAQLDGHNRAERRQDPPQHWARQVDPFWPALLDLTFLRVCRWSVVWSYKLKPGASICHQAHLSSNLPPVKVMPAGFHQLGGEVNLFSLRVFHNFKIWTSFFFIHKVLWYVVSWRRSRYFCLFAVISYISVVDHDKTIGQNSFIRQFETE